MLVQIGSNWEIGNASTVYALSKITGARAGITSTNYKVSRLYSKGLIEVVGFGKGNCKAYAPSALGKQVLAELCAG